jgi:phage-related baseplate assembly protein
VLLTVAGEAGAELSPEVLRDVLDDLNSRRDRNRRLVVNSHKAVPVRISGRVQVQSAYLAQSVIAALQAALGHLFGFDQRELGQPAFVSEVFRVCQAVTGVTAVDLDEFRYRDKGTVPLADALIAEPHEILQLAAADLDLRPQFATL